MKKGYIKVLIISINLILILVLNNIYNFLETYTLIIFLVISVITSFFYIGYEKNRHRYEKDTLLTILIYSTVYLISTNIFGIYVGFNKTGYSLKPLLIFQNIFPAIVIIVLSEIIRYMIMKRYSKFKISYILSLIIFILIDTTLSMSRYNFELLDEVINVVIGIFLPVISKNIMLNYVVAKVGYRPTILYRIIFEIPIYFLPIFPDFGLYIGSILQIVSPMILLYIINHNFKKMKNKVIIRKELNLKLDKIGIGIFAILVIIIVVLSSGLFKYYLLTIGSGSMTGTINKGDIVIVKKLNEKEKNNLEEGQILVFNYSKKVIVHRIIRKVVIYTDYYFYTKGDNNQAEDGYPIKTDEIIGITYFRIPYLGFPAVWLSELIKK